MKINTSGLNTLGKKLKQAPGKETIQPERVEMQDIQEKGFTEAQVFQGFSEEGKNLPIAQLNGSQIIWLLYLGTERH